jgi:hypothetical protein
MGLVTWSEGNKESNGKGNVIPELNYLSTIPWRYIGEWKYNSTIHNLGTGWRWVVSLTLRPLYHRGNRLRCPLYRRLFGPQSRSRRYGEETNLLFLLGIEPRILGRAAHNQVATPTDMYQMYLFIYFSLFNDAVTTQIITKFRKCIIKVGLLYGSVFCWLRVGSKGLWTQ